MRSTAVTHLGLVAVAAWLCSGCAASFSGSDRAAIASVLTAQEEAWNRGDVVAYMDGYERSPALIFTSGGKVRRGFDETLAKYQKSYADRGAMGKLALEVLDLRPLGANAAVMLGRWTLTETPRAATGLFSLVWERRDGRWLVVHDHTSVSR